jgi:hypothetical protein
MVTMPAGKRCNGFRKALPLACLLLPLVACPPIAGADKGQSVLAEGFITRTQVDSARKRIAAGDPHTLIQYRHLLMLAEQASRVTPEAVQDFSVPAYYGDNRARHDELRDLLNHQAKGSFYLALAAALETGESYTARQYTERALKLILNWAKTNSSVSDEDGYLVLCYNGIGFLHAAELLDLADAWSPAERQVFEDWVKNVFIPSCWIKSRYNNWACWGIFASLSANRFLKRDDAFQNDIVRLKEIIDEQIEPDGSMPHELKRGSNSFWYTYFALAPLTAAMQIARNNGSDLFDYDPPSGGSVKQAIGFYFEKGIKHPDQWPVPGSNSPLSDGQDGLLLYAMGSVYNNSDWTRFARYPLHLKRSGLAWVCPVLLQP